MVASYKTLLGLVAIGLVLGSVQLESEAPAPAPAPAPTLTPSELPIPMVAENGKTYSVSPGETLADAMVRAAAQEEEKGHCVPEPMKKKPPGSVGCACYELTHCEGGESRQCKRHCRKDLCECCSI